MTYLAIKRKMLQKVVKNNTLGFILVLIVNLNQHGYIFPEILQLNCQCPDADLIGLCYSRSSLIFHPFCFHNSIMYCTFVYIKEMLLLTPEIFIDLIFMSTSYLVS